MFRYWDVFTSEIYISVGCLFWSLHLRWKSCFVQDHVNLPVQQGMERSLRDPEVLSLVDSTLCVDARSLQSCPTLCNPMDCSPPGSSVHGILQARILDWVAMPSSRGSFWPEDWTCISCIAGRFFTHWATWEVEIISLDVNIYLHLRLWKGESAIYFMIWIEWWK